MATTYVQLSRDLFNAAFVSCWSELDETLQDDLLHSLRQALTSQDIPEITQTLLNLAEFMEHCDKGQAGNCGGVDQILLRFSFELLYLSFCNCSFAK